MRHLTYFVSDVHLGLEVGDPTLRERRFVDFLRSIPAEETETLYLLGDIWDFWYEYEDVVPKGYVRVFAALTDLIAAGVKVCFFEGNHDMWAFHYFEELGMVRCAQPYVVKIGSKNFCLGHGDGLGPGMYGYKLMRWAFHNRFLQSCFSALHPYLAFRLAEGWSRKSRLSRREAYYFRGEDEPLWKWCRKFNEDAVAAKTGPREQVDYFIFGHYHCRVDCKVGEARLLLLKDWIDSPDSLVFDSDSGTFQGR